MRRHFAILITSILGIVFLCGGCASRFGARQSAEPVAGLKPTTTRAAYSDEQLIQIQVATMGFAEWYLARLAGACDALAGNEAAPQAGREAAKLKATQASSVYGIIAAANPIVQILNLVVVTDLTHLKWVEEGKATAVFGNDGKVLSDALDDMRLRAHAHALRVISDGELQVVTQAVQRWRRENPEISDVEFIRFDDFAAELARSLTSKEQEDMLANLKATAAGISDARILGERAMLLMSRFPRLVQWQIEAQLGDLAARPQTRQALGDLSQLSRTLAEFKQQAAQLQTSLDSFPQKLADSLAGAPAVKQALATANDAVLQSDQAIKQLVAVDNAVHQLDAAVTDLGKQISHINSSYDAAEVEKMAARGRLVVVGEVKSLIYLIAACITGLIALHALLRRFTMPRAGARS